MPFLMSVWPIAIHTLAPDGIIEAPATLPPPTQAVPTRKW